MSSSATLVQSQSLPRFWWQHRCLISHLPEALTPQCRYWESLTSQFYAKDGLGCKEDQLPSMVYPYTPVPVSGLRKQLYMHPTHCILETMSERPLTVSPKRLKNQITVQSVLPMDS
ncbi:uncharacterized protein LOC141684719 [Apium graveolens]|uniref:uncharacterized protein LOC141684719 n=1 Tax=Apium graveolens TaxID=4045 RepID=UPI003D7ADD45